VQKLSFCNNKSNRKSENNQKEKSLEKEEEEKSECILSLFSIIKSSIQQIMKLAKEKIKQFIFFCNQCCRKYLCVCVCVCVCV